MAGLTEPRAVIKRHGEEEDRWLFMHREPRSTTGWLILASITKNNATRLPIKEALKVVEERNSRGNGFTYTLEVLDE